MASPASAALADWLAERFALPVRACRPVGGGCIHSAWSLTLADGSRFFAKSGPAATALPLLEAEADGLAALAAAADDARLVVPMPLALERVGSEAVLLLPWLVMGGGDWQGLGSALADLHRRSLMAPLQAGDRVGTAFGWSRDNVIGALPQSNGWLEDWALFFRERRLAPQLERLARARGPLPGAAELLERTREWLAGHDPEPCLVHGDLWSGNAAALADGRGALFDPAVHRADREVDLAMARLFGGFPEAFFQGYAQEWPLPSDHRRRVDLYNLYHLLNHANLFGGGYDAQVRELIHRLLRDGPTGD
jgi:fructosamine-3-kinase